MATFNKSIEVPDSTLILSAYTVPTGRYAKVKPVDLGGNLLVNGVEAIIPNIEIATGNATVGGGGAGGTTFSIYTQRADADGMAELYVGTDTTLTWALVFDAIAADTFSFVPSYGNATQLTGNTLSPVSRHFKFFIPRGANLRALKNAAGNQTFFYNLTVRNIRTQDIKTVTLAEGDTVTSSGTFLVEQYINPGANV